MPPLVVCIVTMNDDIMDLSEEEDYNKWSVVHAYYYNNAEFLHFCTYPFCQVVLRLST